MRNMFGGGSNYPPGCSGPPDEPCICEVCGTVEDCICPTCPICGELGDLTCYKVFVPGLYDKRKRKGCDLKLDEEQKTCRRNVLKNQRKEEKYWKEYAEQEEKAEKEWEIGRAHV